MKIKIELKHWITGAVLFEYESENNTQLATLKEAVKLKKDLTGADLRGAYLTGADLTGAYLRGANLTGANLTGADLTGAYLRGAYLTGADLTGANLTGANLTGEKIKSAAVFTGLYAYIVIPYITEGNEQRVKMGCHNRTLDDWNKDFWNNNSEFPNDGSLKSEMRVIAFEAAKKWLQIASK